MGAQSSILTAVGTAAIGANKVAEGIGQAKDKFLKSMISEANDATKANAAKNRAKKNKEAAIKNKKEQKVNTDQILKKKEKEVTSVLQGSNTDPKTRVNVMQELRER